MGLGRQAEVKVNESRIEVAEYIYLGRIITSENDINLCVACGNLCIVDEEYDSRKLRVA